MAKISSLENMATEQEECERIFCKGDHWLNLATYALIATEFSNGLASSVGRVFDCHLSGHWIEPTFNQHFFVVGLTMCVQRG